MKIVINKRKSLFFAAILLCITLLCIATYAYYLKTARARNVITTGKIDITIVEQQKVGDEFLPYPDEPISVMPSTEVSKIVAVKCEEEKAYIRMKYSVVFEDRKGKTLDLDTSVVEIIPTGKNWIEKDGWFYYNAPLSAGEVTEPLFETVKFASLAMDNKYQKTVLTLRIHAQSVQFANNPAPDGDITAVSGWPKS